MRAVLRCVRCLLACAVCAGSFALACVDSPSRGLVSFASASNAATVLRAAVRAVIAPWRLSCACLRSDAICVCGQEEGVSEGGRV